MPRGPVHFPTRQQEKRSQEIFKAAIGVAKRGRPFGALDVHFALTGAPIKPCGKSGNPTPGISRTLRVMVDDGYIIQVTTGRPMLYQIAQEPRREPPAPAPGDKYHSLISAPTKAMLTQGKARPARSRPVANP